MARLILGMFVGFTMVGRSGSTHCGMMRSETCSGSTRYTLISNSRLDSRSRAATRIEMPTIRFHGPALRRRARHRTSRLAA